LAIRHVKKTSLGWPDIQEINKNKNIYVYLLAISSLTGNPWPQFPMIRKYLSKDTCSAWLVGIPSFGIYYRNSILIITGSFVISLFLVGYTIGIPIITGWLSNRNIPIHYPIIEISLV